MKKLLHLWKRWQYIKPLLTADIFILIVKHNAAPVNRQAALHTNIREEMAITYILLNTVEQIEEVQRATDSLINQLGIKKMDR